jgi:hypothetical protein
MARSRRSRASSVQAQGQDPPREFLPERHEPRAWAAAGLAVVLVWALLFLPQLFLGQHFVLGDSSAFRPFPEFSRARWHETRERTYWNPYVFMGIESVASLADPRPQYLPDPLLDATEHLSEPAAAPQLWLLLAHLAGTLAVVVLARRLWGADPWSAATGGLTWLVTIPILSPLAYGHDAQVLADALLPVAALGTHVVIASGRPRAVLGGALALALALGIQCLHGHPQIVVYSSTLILLFALHQAWTRRRWKRLLPWGAAVALGAAIGTAVWWPAMLYSDLSSRGGGSAAGVSLLVVAKYSLHWRDLLSIAWPQAVGFGGATYWGGMQVTDYAPYLGAVAIALALGGFRRAAFRGDATSRFWWAVFLVSLAFSLGVNLGGPFGFVHAHVPLWNKFRVPLYVLIGACLALALLVARGLSRAVLPSAGPERWMSLRGVLIALAVLALAGLALEFGPPGAFYADLARTLRSSLDETTARAAARFAGLDLLSRSALVACACTLLLLARAGRTWTRPALALLVVLDLASVGAPGLWRATGPHAAIEAPAATPLAKVAARAPQARAYVGAARPVQDSVFADRRYAESYTNFWVSWRAHCLTGNHGAFPSVWQTAMKYELTRSESVLRAWGVDWLDLDRATPAPAGLTPVTQDARAAVYALGAPLGRAYAVPLVVALQDEDAVAGAMAYPGFDPAAVAVTTDPSVAGAYPGSSSCVIRWIRDDPQWLVLETAAPDRAFLVVADSDFPGWSAWVDGSRAQIAPTDLLVRGIPLPGGRHRVEMRYETPGMREAVPVTRAGLALWLFIAVAGNALVLLGPRLRRRRAAEGTGVEGPTGQRA